STGDFHKHIAVTHSNGFHSRQKGSNWEGSLAPNQTTPSNSLLPFYTALKPTFGCRFSWDTDHKIRSSGIDAKKPSFTVHHIKWRSVSL
uniref:Uncharacterized protein n=1 Tax=Gadus morhua TaxID=8049 RepID=A0A8C5CUE2_GADMO